MANRIQYINNAEGDHVFPVTHVGGVLDDVGADLETKLGGINDALEALDSKIDTISTGKYYGYFADSEDLPATGEAGFAYVGEGPEYTIWNFDGTTWTDSGVSVSQAPVGNEEDIDQDAEGRLRFADRVYNDSNPDGMGYKILRKSASFASQVASANTIYVIRNEYNLGGATVNIPENVILRFEGGKIKNGTLAGAKTVVDAPGYHIFDSVSFSGTFGGALNAKWIGAKSGNNAFDNGEVLSAFLQSYSGSWKRLLFPCGTYYFLSQSSLTSDTRDLVIDGDNSLFNVNIPDTDAYWLYIKTGGASSAEGFRLENCRIKNVQTTDGSNISRTRAILFDGTQRFEVCNVQIWYFDIAVHIVNVWYGGFSGQNAFRFNRIGLLFDARNYIEDNTIEVHNVDFKGIARSVVAKIYSKEEEESDEAYLMRTASSGIDAYCLLQGVGFRGCIFESLDYGIRTNWIKRASKASDAGGPFAVDSCYFEDNRVEDIYVGPGYTSYRGSGSSYYYYTHYVSITNCRFNTLKHAYMYGAVASISGNQPFTLKITGGSYVTTNVSYQGRVTIEEGVGANTTAYCIENRGTAVRDANGNNTLPASNFQRLQIPRFYGIVTQKLDGFSKTSTNTGTDTSYQAWNFNLDPGVRFGFDVMPYEGYVDSNNAYRRLCVPSGNSWASVAVSADYLLRAMNAQSGISLAEFIRRWNNGTAYTGRVRNLFPTEIIADPEAGTIQNASGTLLGFGSAALGTTVTTSTTTGYYLYVDALVWVRISYSRIKFVADALQCGRSYGEIRGDVDDSSTNTAYLSVYGSEAGMDSVQKRMNAVYYDSTNSKLMIYTGYEWVEMTSPFKRYYYSSYGNKLSERPTMAELPGQTWTNYATGITYTFTFRPRNNFRWAAGIGEVVSLDNPNGYALDTSLSYTNELSAGDLVRCNGEIYKWNGTGFSPIATSTSNS